MSTELTKDHIKRKLQTDDRWLEAGVLAIWRFQTEHEKVCVNTLNHNNVGFNGADGSFMTSLGNYLNRGNHLTDKQKYIARRKMVKYAGQLLQIAKRKAETGKTQSIQS